MAVAGLPSASLTGWPSIGSSVFVKNRLVVATSQTVRPQNRFTFYETSAVEVPVRRARRPFTSGGFSTRIVMRSSIAPMVGTRLAADDAGFVMLPGGRVPPPVSWCCVAGKEVLLESDGRPTAPTTTGAGMDGNRLRLLMRVPDGDAVLRSFSPQTLTGPDAYDPSASTGTVTARPAAGTTAVATGVIAWVPEGEPRTLALATPTDAGVEALRTVRMPGDVVAVAANPGLVVVTLRTGRSYRVLRVLPDGRSATAWRGAQAPRVAVGRGLVVVAVGRVVLASRSGAVKRVTGARGPVAGVAADGDRLAWFERVTVRVPTGVRRKGKVVTKPQRRTVARIARVAR